MTFWMVRDSGMEERISRDWMLLMILFLILYLMLVVMLAPSTAPIFAPPIALALTIVASPITPPYEATDEDAEAPLAPEASETGAEIVTEAPLVPEVKDRIR